MSINLGYAAGPPVVSTPDELLLSANAAEELFQQLSNLHDNLTLASRGLAGMLGTLQENHTSAIWSGNAANRSRRSLHSCAEALGAASGALEEILSDLNARVRQARQLADELWSQWRFAIYSQGVSGAAQ